MRWRSCSLAYLHEAIEPKVVHRDIKSSNILIDDDFNAKVSDFGLAKFLQDSGTSECMSAIAGSYGYIAPGTIRFRKLSHKHEHL